MASKYRNENYAFIEAEMNPNSHVSNAVQKLVIDLEYSNLDGKYKIVQVTSTLPSEGKTTLVGNISYILAQKGYKTLVMDLDLRKPKINRLFNHANVNGLSDYLLGNLSKEDLIIKSDRGIHFIVSGSETSSVTSILESQKLKDLMEQLKEEYDYIILDTPPMQVNADALMAAKLADGALYVIGHNIVRKTFIKDGITALRRKEVPIIGIVMTQVKMSKSKHYYYNYD